MGKYLKNNFWQIKWHQIATCVTLFLFLLATFFSLSKTLQVWSLLVKSYQFGPVGFLAPSIVWLSEWMHELAGVSSTSSTKLHTSGYSNIFLTLFCSAVLRRHTAQSILSILKEKCLKLCKENSLDGKTELSGNFQGTGSNTDLQIIITFLATWTVAQIFALPCVIFHNF